MHLSVLVAFKVALAIAVTLPGPGIFAVVSCALRRGLRVALALIAGIILGGLIFFYLAVPGLAALARSMGEFFIIVKFAGAASLVWLGIKLWMGGSVILVVGLIPAAYAFAAAASRRFFRNPARLRMLNRTAGTMRIGSGVTVAAR